MGDIDGHGDGVSGCSEDELSDEVDDEANVSDVASDGKQFVCLQCYLVTKLVLYRVLSPMPDLCPSSRCSLRVDYRHEFADTH